MMISENYDQEVFSIADKVLTEKGRSFHWARYLLSKSHASRATRLYAFCRYIDDLADEAESVTAAREALIKAAASIRSGISSDRTIMDGLHLIHECGIDLVHILDLIKGVESDLGIVKIADLEELLQYCYRVAGTVGLMMCRVLDVKDAAAYQHAIDLGIAMQLTNICRDVSEDAALGRRYLPASLIGEVSPDELITPHEVLQPTLRHCIATLLEYADHFYNSGERGLSYLPFRARTSIVVAARIYQAIGTELRHNNYDYWVKRAVVDNKKKVVVTARTFLTAPLKPSFWWPNARNEHPNAA